MNQFFISQWLVWSLFSFECSLFSVIVTMVHLVVILQMVTVDIVCLVLDFMGYMDAVVVFCCCCCLDVFVQ